mgnify:CR=1 FL=1
MKCQVLLSGIFYIFCHDLSFFVRKGKQKEPTSILRTYRLRCGARGRHRSQVCQPPARNKTTQKRKLCKVYQGHFYWLHFDKKFCQVPRKTRTDPLWVACQPHWSWKEKLKVLETTTLQNHCACARCHGNKATRANFGSNVIICVSVLVFLSFGTKPQVFPSSAFGYYNLTTVRLISKFFRERVSRNTLKFVYIHRDRYFWFLG